jgi:anti-sigma regulatory factor (Ser/Thr protein kinase)
MSATTATAPPHDDPMHTTQHFPSDPAQVGVARRFVLSHLDPASPRYDDLELCTSEVVTNALRHTGDRDRGFDVTVQMADGQVEVTVVDAGGKTVPTIRQGGETRRTNGRGVGIVDQLADRWGFRRGEDGSTHVWFILRT